MPELRSAISEFYKKNFKKNPKIAITGLNPHCESNFKDCEEDAIIIPAIKDLKAKNFRVQWTISSRYYFYAGTYKKI